MTASLHDLLAGWPAGATVDAAAVARRAAEARRTLVVLDDDPTGTQSVADLPVLLDWTRESFDWAFGQGRPAVYVMTNSRSLAPDDAARVTREVVRSALASAQATGLPLTFVSRSDSTLRGHFPLETDVLAEEIGSVTGEAITGVVIVPAFGDAGRVTIGGVHYAAGDGGYRPVGETEFARDATFGYAASDLRDWVAEKSDGRLPAAQVALVDLARLRTDHEGVVRRLSTLQGGPVVVDIVTEDDLRLLALAVLDAESRGARLLFRSGPPFPRALIGQAPHPPLDRAELASIRSGGLAEHAVGGLVVVGSHVSLTTQQLERLMARRSPHRIELEVARVLAEETAHVDAVIDEAAAALATGDVVLSTSRRLVTASTAADSLAVARAVSDAVVAAVARIVAQRAPRFVVAKGGITSSDVAARGLGISRAMVRGPMLPGIVSLWEPVGGPARGIPYIVFAGNVGGPDSLADVVDALAER